MAKKTTQTKEALLAGLVPFEIKAPTAQEMAKQQLTVERLQKELGIMDMSEEISKGSVPQDVYTAKSKDFERESVLLQAMEGEYYRQGIIPIDRESDPEMQQMDRLQNRINRLSLENEILYARIGLTGKEDYTQADQNVTLMQDLKKEYHAIEAQYYGEKARLAAAEGKVTIKPQEDQSYRVTVVLDGKAYNGKMTQQEHDRMLALDDRQKINFLQKLMPSADIKGQDAATRQRMLTTANESLYNISKPEVYASATENQGKQQTIGRENAAVLAAAAFESMSQENTTEQSRNVGMSR